jgi:hypothetical protein
MIDATLYNHIIDNFTYTGEFKFGSAEGAKPPYIIQLKVADLERPETLCESQGDSGRALFQFSAYGGSNDTDPVMKAYDLVGYLEGFKNQMQSLKGNIGVNPDDYKIWENQTGSVRPLGEGVNSLGTWGAFFQSFIWWEKL